VRFFDVLTKDGKLVAGSGITLTEGSDGGDETLTIAAGTGSILAWITLDASSGTPTSIADSGNISSITDNGVGDYTFNFSPALSTANYAVTGTGNLTAGNRLLLPVAADSSGVFSMSTTACQVKVFETVGQSYADPKFISIMFVA